MELPHLNKEERVNLYPTSELEIPPNNEINILLKAREKVKKTLEKGARDVIVFPNLKILKKKGLLANTNAICSKGELLLKFFNPFSTGVKISKHDNLAFGLKADKNFQSYLDRALVRKIRRNLEKSGKANTNEEILNLMSLAEDEIFDKGEICQLGKKETKKNMHP